MAAKETLLSNPVLVTSSDTNSSEVQFTQDQILPTDIRGIVTLFITIVSGTFQFNVGSAVVSSSASYTVGDTVPPITIVNGAKNLFYKAGAGSQTFKVSAA